MAGRASKLWGWRVAWSSTSRIMVSGSISTILALQEPEHGWALQGKVLLCRGMNEAPSPMLQTPSHSRGAQALGRGWHQGCPQGWLGLGLLRAPAISPRSTLTGSRAGAC